MSSFFCHASGIIIMAFQTYSHHHITIADIILFFGSPNAGAGIMTGSIIDMTHENTRSLTICIACMVRKRNTSYLRSQ